MTYLYPPAILACFVIIVQALKRWPAEQEIEQPSPKFDIVSFYRIPRRG